MKPLQEFGKAILLSYAQIFFSNRAWLGGAALIASMMTPLVGGLGLLGVIAGNGIALALRFDREKMAGGFYGFNCLLVGAAAGFYLELTPGLFLLILIFFVITFLLSAALEHFLATIVNLPGLSLPFVFSAYIMLVFLTNIHPVYYRDMSGLSFSGSASLSGYVVQFFRALGMILFQTNWLAGVLLAGAMLMFSRVMFLNSIVAFSANALFLHFLFPDLSGTMFLVASLNAILLSLALGGSLIILSRKTVPLILVATLMVIVFTGFFGKVLVAFFLPVLVLPFNIIVLATLYTLKFRQEHSDLVLVYFAPGSPEENYYYHHNRKARFDRFRSLFPELPFMGEWKVSQGIDGALTHKSHWSHAWDFVIADAGGREHAANAVLPEHYYCYDAPVMAPLEGDVVRVYDSVPDNAIGATNLKHNWGNTIVINHGAGLLSSLSHLKPESIKVKVGEAVKKGQTLARCGNSGRSPTPHLHFQFQATDRIGERTLKFPIAHFLERQDDVYRVRTSEFPSEGSIVTNIESHRVIRRAFDLSLGQELEFACELNGARFAEIWTVHADVFNNMFIESSRGPRAYVYLKEKMFYMTGFVGSRASALYYFYLLAVSIPLGYHAGLRWEDRYPANLTIHHVLRYLSEFFLVFGPQLSSHVELRYGERDSQTREFVVESTMHHKGKGLFSLYEREGWGKVVIDEGEFIKQLQYRDGSTSFVAVAQHLAEGDS